MSSDALFVTGEIAAETEISSTEVFHDYSAGIIINPVECDDGLLVIEPELDSIRSSVNDTSALKSDVDVLWQMTDRKRQSLDEQYQIEVKVDEAICSSNESKNAQSSESDEKFECRKEKDRVKKRAQRLNPIFREREKIQTRLRMKSKREDVSYREKEKQRDRARRKDARRKTNKDMFGSEATQCQTDQSYESMQDHFDYHLNSGQSEQSFEIDQSYLPSFTNQPDKNSTLCV